jgi:hypothetical protein
MNNSQIRPLSKLQSIFYDLDDARSMRSNYHRNAASNQYEDVDNLYSRSQRV